MENFVGSSYDRAMSDVNNHLFTNVYNDCAKDESEAPDNYNVDDFGNHIYDNDWVFIGYVKLGNVKRKFVASQEGFLTALDEYDPDNFLLNELEIISGKEWLGARWMEERQ